MRAVSGDCRPNRDVREAAERVSSCLGLNMLGGARVTKRGHHIILHATNASFYPITILHITKCHSP